MSGNLGVALIGLDHWYSAFMLLDQIAASDEVYLAGIADENGAHLAEAEEKYRPTVATRRAADLLDREEVEVVFSFVPTADNPAVCMEALGRGKHTFCVKPPAMSVTEASGLAAAAEDSGVFYSSTEVLPRLTERARFLKELLRGGAIGQPITFYHAAHGGLPQPWAGETGDSWWLNPAKVPGGAWLDHAIYAVDFVRWALEKEVVSVTASVDNRIHQMALEDWGLAVMEMEGGFVAALEDTWTASTGTRFDRWIGTEGSLEPDGEAFILRRNGKAERLEPPEETASAIDHIAGAIRGRARLPFTPVCSVHNLAACLAAYESARTGERTAPLTA